MVAKRVTTAANGITATFLAHAAGWGRPHAHAKAISRPSRRSRYWARCRRPSCSATDFEALNEEAATGSWPPWRQRWDRLIETIGIIRALWTGESVRHKGRFYSVDARLYDPPAQPIPLLTAANGRKSMRLAGFHGDGLVTDPMAWKQHKAEWEAGARESGRTPPTCRCWSSSS